MEPKIIRAGDRQTKIAPAHNFVGHVLHESVFAEEAPSRLRVSRVTFTPGGRTNWHTHAVGYQLEGQPVEEINAGDTVVIPPNARHWHGAAPDSMMCHLALSEADDQGNGATWLEPVDDKDFTQEPA